MNEGLKVKDSPQVRESGKCLLVESGIPLWIGIQNLSSTDKQWNPVPGIQNSRRGIQNPILSWILLHEDKLLLPRTKGYDQSTILFLSLTE